MLGYLRTNLCLKKALLRVLVDLDMEHQREGRSAGSREPTTGESSGSQKEMTTRGTPGRGAQESEDAGMGQMSWRLREAREEGDPELIRREEDLHARQQNLAERERSLKDRDEQLRTREQGMKERQTRVTGKGLGATDYTDEIHIQNRR